jgi:SPP1 family predicted phage head-tail adaptor
MICCKYSAGKMREPVTFQRLGAATNVDGNVVAGAWATIAGAPTRGMVRPLSGYEASQAQRLSAEVKLLVAVRYTAALREADSVLIRGLRHNIRYIKNVDFGNKWLEIDVEGGVAV